MNSQRISRRAALGASAAAAGAFALSPTSAIARSHVLKKHGKLPVAKMQEILQTEGDVSGGVLSVDMDRDDLAGKVKGFQGIEIKPPFQIDAEFFFQPLSDELAAVNGDLPVTNDEVTGVIDEVLASGL